MKKTIIAIMVLMLATVTVVATGWLDIKETRVSDGVLIDAVALADGSTLAVTLVRNQYGQQLWFTHNVPGSAARGSVTLPNQSEDVQSIIITANGDYLHVFIGWQGSLPGGGATYRYTVELPTQIAEGVFHHRVYLPLVY